MHDNGKYFRTRKKERRLSQVHMRFKDSPRKGRKGGSSWLEELKKKVYGMIRGIDFWHQADLCLIMVVFATHSVTSRNNLICLLLDLPL